MEEFQASVLLGRYAKHLVFIRDVLRRRSGFRFEGLKVICITNALRSQFFNHTKPLRT